MFGTAGTKKGFGSETNFRGEELSLLILLYLDVIFGLFSSSLLLSISISDLPSIAVAQRRN